uniref:Archease domain-containing protein n=1 Tax=Encephalitozoon cuniculi TaxID=6035 RepID=M1KK48_ENCCN|nr:hypothetical protein ECU02_0980 [Encephalitozoon cuniculi]
MMYISVQRHCSSLDPHFFSTFRVGHTDPQYRMQGTSHTAMKATTGKSLESIEFLDHPADIQMHCTASSLPELYEVAIKGMMSCSVRISATDRRLGRVELSETSDEMNMVGLLTHFMDLMYGEGLVVTEAAVLLRNGLLVCDYAVTSGSRCQSLCEIKAVTLCGLRVFEEDGIFHLYCIFDV